MSNNQNDSNPSNQTQYDLILRVADRLNEVRDDVTHIKVTLERNTAGLEEHIRGVRALEANLAILRTEVKPLQDWHVTLGNILRIAAGGATLFALVAGAAKLLGFKGF